MRDLDSMIRGNVLAQNWRNRGIPGKGRAIKGLVVCNSWVAKRLAIGCYQLPPEVLIVLFIVVD